MRSDARPLIVHVVHSLEGGGTERTLVSYLQAADVVKRRHAVAPLRQAGRLAELLPQHVACRPLGAIGRSRLNGVRLARCTRRWDASVLHARNSGCWFDALVASRLTPGAKLVLGHHGLENADPIDRRTRRTARWALRSGARFVTVSESGKRQLSNEAGIPLERIHVLRSGVQFERFSTRDAQDRARLRGELGWNEDAFVVGIIASLTPVKRHESLIESIAALQAGYPHVRLLIVGDGPYREELRQLTESLGLSARVCFAGHREDVARWYAIMDAYVCCSESEGLSNALLEAMASGLPSVTTNVGDHALILRDGVDGFVLPSGSAEALGGILADLATSTELRRRFGEAARLRASAFRLEDSVRAYECYYDNLIRSRLSPEPALAT